MWDSGEWNSKTSEEFKFSSNNFDGLRFFNDRLKINEDVNKVKSIGQKKMFQNLSSYLMRCVILS